MAIITPLRTTTTASLAARLARCGGVGFAFEVIGTIARRGLLTLASEGLCLQLPILAPKLFDLLFQGGDASDGLSMHALPVARLLSEFEIVTPQSSHFSPQGSNFLAELRDQPGQRRALIGIRHGIAEEFLHDLLVLASSGRRWTEQLEQNAESTTA
jgi:hypothetical protein